MTNLVGAWERRQGEPAMWFSRFDTYYRPIGPERSLLAAYNAWRGESGRGKATGAPVTWISNAKAWDWRQRAEAWDAAERAKRHRLEEDERLKQRAGRRTILLGLKAKLAEAITKLDPTDMTPKEILAAIQLILEQERIEYDDEPAQKHAGEITVRFEGNVEMDKL